MKEQEDHQYVKRSQKDYSYAFKLQVVQEIERGEENPTSAQHKYGIQSRSTVINWLRKYGSFDWVNQTPSFMPKSAEQRLMEMEQKVRLLEKQKHQLEQQLEQSDKKSIFFDMMIELAEKEYKIDIRKNSSSRQSTASRKHNKKA